MHTFFSFPDVEAAHIAFDTYVTANWLYKARNTAMKNAGVMTPPFNSHQFSFHVRYDRRCWTSG